MKRSEYMTVQRRSLIDFLSENSDRHFTIEEIVDALDSGEAHPGKSTVYRQMKRLLELGQVRRFETSESRSFVYQYANETPHCGEDEHFHIKCARCGRLIHMDCEQLAQVSRHIAAEHDFIIGAGHGVIYGECTACAESEKSEGDGA